MNKSLIQNPVVDNSTFIKSVVLRHQRCGPCVNRVRVSWFLASPMNKLTTFIVHICILFTAFAVWTAVNRFYIPRCVPCHTSKMPWVVSGTNTSDPGSWCPRLLLTAPRRAHRRSSFISAFIDNAAVLLGCDALFCLQSAIQNVWDTLPRGSIFSLNFPSSPPTYSTTACAHHFCFALNLCPTVTHLTFCLYPDFASNTHLFVFSIRPKRPCL